MATPYLYTNYGTSTCYPKIIWTTTSSATSTTIWYPYLNNSSTTAWGLDYTSNTIITTGGDYLYYNKIDYKQILKAAMQRRLAPEIYTKAKPLGFTKDFREIRARETLHNVIGDDNYKKFLRKGFISIKAKSGKIYQIFPGHGITQIYDNGIMIGRHCVVLQGDFPPTDSLIMRYLLILNNEDLFNSYAIKHEVFKPHKTIATKDSKSLIDLMKEYKSRAA